VDALFMGRPTEAYVSLAALTHNCRQAGALVGDGVRVIAVVKADGYGHGAVAAARAFVRGGAAQLGVSSLAEGLELRQAGVPEPIIALGGLFAGEAADAVAHDVAVAVWTRESVEALAGAARAAGRPARVHLKIDTGMTRLGLDIDGVGEFGRVLAGIAGLEIAGVFSHLASADDVVQAAVQAQIARFRDAVAALRAAGVAPGLVHLANSAAVLAAPAAHFDAVRPGLMLYGYAPAPHLAGRAVLRPALRLSTRIAQTRRVPAGRPVGYGGSWVASRPSTIGVLPIGYADGYHRLASNRAAVVVRGRRVPIAGRVCMDHVMIDVTDLPGVAPGEPVVMMGEAGGAAVWADELAAWCETIPYEMLTAVGKRVPRVHGEEFDG
jgi:alanine racemase